jgi:E3 ubiquitin-protein ligase RGLG
MASMEMLLSFVLVLALVSFCGGAGLKARFQAVFGAPAVPYTIHDKFKSLAELKTALHKTSLESCNLIVAVDFTKSNEWTGQRSYNGRNLHHAALPGGPANHYETALGLCAALSEFDEDGLIPAYGFGDATTKARDVFSFLPDDAPCAGLDEVLQRYRELAPRVSLNGGTSFAPAIRKACALIAKGDSPSYHILLLVCDGQVSDECRAETVRAIVEASTFPLSIVCVGVGDGPWEEMERFDDDIPARRFDNFQFVPLVKTMAEARRSGVPQAEAFALAALMEVPEGFASIKKLGLLSRPRAPAPPIVRTLEPPVPCIAAGSGGGAPRAAVAAPRAATPRAAAAAPVAAAAAGAPRAAPPAAAPPGAPECAICMDRRVDRIFPCGHPICGACEGGLARPRLCHVCRAPAPRSMLLFL